MAFSRKHEHYSPASGYSPRRKRLAGDAWIAAIQLTDNRLRAMRWWRESGREGHIAKMKWLRANLVRLLKELSEEAHRDLHHDRSAARINALVDCVENLPTRGDSRFEAIYQLIGMPIPETVGSASVFPATKPRIGEIGEKSWDWI